MHREAATKLARELMDQYGLNHWSIRCVNDLRTNSFLGKCIHDKKQIALNIHHVDIHPDFEIIDTIKHEIAHALVGHSHGHDSVWEAKALELGARPSATCDLTLDPKLIDAIRSGYIVEPVVESKVTGYKVTRLQDKCPVCGKVAKELKTFEFNGKRLTTLECLHVVVKDIPKETDYSLVIFDGEESCKHSWDLPVTNEYKTVCSKCNAKRPYLFQQEGMKMLEKYDGKFGIMDEQGLGKTIQALGYIKFHPENVPFLWIGKSSLKYQYAKEFVRVLGKQFFPYVFETSKDFVFPGFNAYVVSYDLLRRMDRKKLDELKARIKIIFIDECQNIKNPDSSRTKEVRELAKSVGKVVPISGTFWKNRGSEAFVACNLINPTKFYSFEDFKKRYVEYYMEGSKLKEGGLKKRFRDECLDVFIRRERSEVMKELPLINRTKLYAQLPKEVMTAYDEEVDKFIAIWNQLVIGGEEETFAAGGSVLAALNRMRQLVGIAKIPATVDYCQEFLENTDRKLVCFVHHVAVGQQIYSQMKPFCEENGIKIFQLTSDLSSEERFRLCEEFNRTKQAFLVASTLASGEGLNLQTCSDCVMHERQWNPANEEQAEGRFIRIGQLATNVNAIYVEASETCDEDLDGIVTRKRVQFHVPMNKGEMPQWNQSSIIKELGNATAERWRKKHKK